MFGFGKNGKRVPGELPDVIEHAPMSGGGDGGDSPFQPGFSNPEEGGGYKTRRNPVKVAMIFLGIAVFFIAFMLYALYDLGIIGSRTRTERGLSISETEYQRRLEEIKDLERRLQFAEDDRLKLLREVEARMNERFAQLDTSTDPAVVARLEEMTKAQQALVAAMADMEARLRARPEEAPPPPMPKMGSTSPSILFSSVPQHVARIKAEEEEMRKRAAVPPPYDDRAGMQIGATIPGVLKTALVSSTQNENFFAVAETTEPFEVSRGFWLPAGVRFLGRVNPDFETRRMFVNVERMQYGNVDVAVKGIMVDHRQNPGMVSKYIDPVTQSFGTNLLLNIASATAAAMLEVGSYTNRVTGEREEVARRTPENAVYQGLSESLMMQSNLLMEAQMRKKPVILVRAGIGVGIQITEKLPLDILVSAGVVDSEPSR